MFPSGPGLQAFQTENLGRKKPSTRCLESIGAECAPQRDVVFAQRGPLFLERTRGSGKTPLLLVRESCFPRGYRARRAAKTLAVPFPEEGFPHTPGFVVQTSKLLKHPATKKNPNSRLWFCLALEMPSNQRVNLSGGVFLVSASCNYLPQRQVSVSPRTKT